MATGSGLDAQIGFGAESTWATGVTPTRFLEFNSESLSLEPTFLEPAGLRAGGKFKRAARVRQSRKTVGGDITLEHATKGMSLLWKHALGSALTTGVADVTDTDAFHHYHVPGDFRGRGLTIQVGTPEPGTGTIVPRTYTGCKVSGWQFSITDGDTPTLQLTVDGQTMTLATALAAASYLAGSGVFDFSQFTLKLGGTASTTDNVISIAGGVTVATVITEVSLSGENPMATERFGIGNGGLKREQLENDIPTITGSLAAEFSKAELYDLHLANTTVPLELTALGDIIDGTTRETLSIILPAVKLKSANPTVEGPDIVQMSTDIEAYDDGINRPIQVHLVTNAAAL